MLTRLRQDRAFAGTAPGSELVVEVFDAVDHVSVVDCERDSVQTLAAHDATEAVRVIGFARRSKDAVQNRPMAHTALFQRVL